FERMKKQPQLPRLGVYWLALGTQDGNPGVTRSPMHLRVFWFVPVLTSAILFPEALTAQAVSGTILGTVRDHSGAAIVNAVVTLTNADTKFTRTVKTDAIGEYVAPSLPPGNYIASAEMQGFKRTE